LGLSLLLAAQTTFAGVLTLVPGTKAVEGVNVAKSATAALPNGAVELATLGAGLRTKKVVITDVKVYVAQVFGSADKYVRTDVGALVSVAAMPAAAVRLTFLRAVDAPTVQTSFRDALVANGVSLNKAEITAFLNAVKASGDAGDKKSLTIVTATSASGDTVIYEGTAGAATTIGGPKGFAKDVLSIWLGKPSDDGVKKLKAQLLKTP
ncbi:MAG TPA: chalcone isomerase family protein, partial [Bdellovibrionales bacterium]|nr:chalcone isomerase family protein [Bdellovibrionales bacterium]